VKGQASQVRPIHALVSLGTGRIPVKPVSTFDVYRPEGLRDLISVAFGAQNIAQLFVDQVSEISKLLILVI
jgi:hypothetical protein